MPVRQRIRTAYAVLRQVGGYKSPFESEHTCEKQEQMLNVACETLSRYMLGDLDEDDDFDGLDLQCLDVARAMRGDPEWTRLRAGDRFAVKSRKVRGEDGTIGYFVYLEQEQADEQADEAAGVH